MSLAMMQDPALRAGLVARGSYETENKGPELLAVIIPVVSISTFFVAARLYVRGRILRKLHLDDYLIIFSLACSWLAVSFDIVGVLNGAGRHAETLTAEQLSKAVRWTFAGFVPAILSLCGPKLAVVALLSRILTVSSPRWHTIFLWAMTIWSSISLIPLGLLLFAQCIPSKSQWEVDTPGKCISIWVLINWSIYASVVSAFVDIYLAVYPSIVLTKVHTSRANKIGLGFALGIGSLSCPIAIYKITKIPALASNDLTWVTSDLALWTITEGCTIIIATAIPILRPLLGCIVRRKRESTSTSHPRLWRKGRRKSSGEIGPAFPKMGLEPRPEHHIHGPRQVRPHNWMYPEEEFLVPTRAVATKMEQTRLDRQDFLPMNIISTPAQTYQGMGWAPGLGNKVSIEATNSDRGSIEANGQGAQIRMPSALQQERDVEREGRSPASCSGILRMNEFCVSVEDRNSEHLECV